MIRRALLLLTFAIPLAALPPSPGRPLNDPIAKGSPVTYAALLRHIFPDLQVKDDEAVSATANHSIAIREFEAKEPSEPLEGEMDIESVTTVDMLHTLMPRVLLSFVSPDSEGDQPERKLALFELAATPRLLDVVGISGFPDDVGDVESHFSIGPATETYVLESYHSNSSQGYQQSTILFIRGDRIEKIADVGLLSSHGYGEIQGFEEEVKLSTLPDPARPYRAIVVRVTLKRLADNSESEYRPLRKASTRYYAAVYHWDAAAKRYVTNSRELAALDAFNRKNN